MCSDPHDADRDPRDPRDGRPPRDARDGAPGPDPDPYTLFHLLSHPRRARTLATLVDAPAHETDVDALAAALAGAAGGDVDAESLTRRELVVSLLHVHLPPLVDAGVVAHDREDGTVALRVPPERLAPFLDLLE
jgi:DNA-binding transcriptional ArsR family regulator